MVGAGGSGFLGGVTAVGAGDFHTCASTAGGALWCWGYNPYGELGNNTRDSSSVPVRVVGPGGTGFLDGVAGVASAQYQTCALTSAGAIWCSGYNADGALGNGTTTDSNVPVQVTGFSGGATPAIAAGGMHTCALRSSGMVWCWGLNTSGQLGNGSTTDSSVPVTVTGLSEATAIATGYQHHLRGHLRWGGLVLGLEPGR